MGRAAKQSDVGEASGSSVVAPEQGSPQRNSMAALAEGKEM